MPCAAQRDHHRLLIPTPLGVAVDVRMNLEVLLEAGANLVELAQTHDVLQVVRGNTVRRLAVRKALIDHLECTQSCGAGATKNVGLRRNTTAYPLLPAARCVIHSRRRAVPHLAHCRSSGGALSHEADYLKCSRRSG